VLEEHAVDAGPVLNLRGREDPTTCPPTMHYLSIVVYDRYADSSKCDPFL
jgi:hypothetical protein